MQKHSWQIDLRRRQQQAHGKFIRATERVANCAEMVAESRVLVEQQRARRGALDIPSVSTRKEEEDSC